MKQLPLGREYGISERTVRNISVEYKDKIDIYGAVLLPDDSMKTTQDTCTVLQPAANSGNSALPAVGTTTKKLMM